MTLLEIIAEWRKGCSNATPNNPEECPTCTLAMIDIIEQRLKQESPKILYCGGWSGGWGI